MRNRGKNRFNYPKKGLNPVTVIRYLFEGFYTNTRSEKLHGHHKEICQYV
jgi:hypothetical protein